MIECPNCRHQNPAGSKFCNNCGRPLPLVCSNCNRVNPPDSSFCNRCGHKLDELDFPSADHERINGHQEQPADQTPYASPSLLNRPQQLVEAFESARKGSPSTAERRIVTILFCDIAGSTAAASQFDPEDWTEIINEIFEIMIRPVYRYNGTVARLMGDGILAFFGAPHAHEDDPVRAVLAGLEMVEGMEAYRERMEHRWGIALNIRVGINTGLVTVGEVGSGQRAEYTAMGDAINLAARMEQTAEPGSVRIAEPTYRLVAGHFKIEALGPVQIKGKDTPQPTYCVLSRLNKADQPRRSGQLKAPFIGREKEIASILKAMEDLDSGLGRVVCLIGQAGLGKSRLIEELQARWVADPLPSKLEGRRRQWAECYGISYETEKPYGLIQQLIGQTLKMVPKKATMAVGVESQAALGDKRSFQTDGDLGESALNLLFGQTLQGEVEGEAFKAALLEAIKHAVTAWQADEPAVLVFEDLHWADSASVELLIHLLDLVVHSPLVIICVFRPDRQTPSWSIRTAVETSLAQQYLEIVLKPLDRAEGSELVDQLLNLPDLPKEIRETIIAKSEGNPFFIEEVARALIEVGAVDQKFHQIKAEIGDELLRIPDTVQALLTARIDRLADESRHALQLASVIGRRFHFAVLLHLHNGTGRLEALIQNLEQADLIEEVSQPLEREFQFNHTLVQEAAYRTILRRDRRIYHRRVGESIEELFPTRIEEFATQLAYHFEEAGDPKAIHYYSISGDIAYRLHANVEAIAHYGRALALLEADPAADPKLLTRLFSHRGRAMELASHYEDALSNYEKMESVAESRSNDQMRLTALVKQGLIRSTVNTLFHPEEARILAERALGVAKELKDREAEARIYWNLLNVSRFGVEDSDQGLVYGQNALKIARELELRELQAHILNDMGDKVGSAGDVHRGKEMVIEAMGLWREVGNRPMLADSLSNTGLWAYFTGDFAGAIAHFDEAYQISEEIHNSWGKAYSLSFIGQVFFNQGQPGRAIAAFHKGIQASEQAGFLIGQILPRSLLGWVYASLGAADYGLKLAFEARGLAQSFVPLEAVCAGLVASVHLLAGDIKAADNILKEIDKRPQTLEIYNKSFIDIFKLQLKLAKGLSKQALPLIEDHLTWLQQMGVRAYVPETLLLKAGALIELGETGKALTTLQSAEKGAVDIGHRRSLWPILARVGKLLGSEPYNNSGQSAIYLARAKEIVQTIADETPENDLASGLNLRERFLNLPAVRELIQ